MRYIPHPNQVQRIPHSVYSQSIRVCSASQFKNVTLIWRLATAYFNLHIAPSWHPNTSVTLYVTEDHIGFRGRK